MLYKDEAVVLRTMRLGEADKIVTFLGREQGKIRAVAKGVRKTKSRFGGRLEPFSQVSLVVWKGRSDLDTVTQVSVIEPFRLVREDLDRFALGEVMLEACDRVVVDRAPSPRTFRLLVDALHALSSKASPMGGPGGVAAARRYDQGAPEAANPPNQLVLAGFLLRLSALAGFAPSLQKCAECGAPAAWFSPVQGGAVCSSCRTADSEEVGTGVLELMADITNEGAWMNTDPAVERTAVRLSRFYTEFHLERRLKSATTADAMAR